jgi:hypothetical protein
VTRASGVISRKVCAVGSLRNPIGPLPSSIYWRRRVVLLSVIALLALLITWIVTSGGGGGKNGAGGSNGKNPVESITPGPSGSESAISQHPGGRDESSGSSSGGSGDGPGSSAGSGGSGGTGGTGSGDGSASGGTGGDGSSGGTGDGASGGGTGTTLPAGSTLPDCTASNVKLTLRSLHNSYGPDQKPTLVLTAKNSAANDCKIDLGPKNTVVTVTKAGSGDAYWSSADCPKGSASVYYRVPGGGSAITYPVKWDRKPSAAECATPPAGSAGAGTYLVEARTPGYPKLQTSFVLSAD